MVERKQSKYSRASLAFEILTKKKKNPWNLTTWIQRKYFFGVSRPCADPISRENDKNETLRKLKPQDLTYDSTEFFSSYNHFYKCNSREK